jgi:hypothetical protein
MKPDPIPHQTLLERTYDAAADHYDQPALSFLPRASQGVDDRGRPAGANPGNSHRRYLCDRAKGQRACRLHTPFGVKRRPLPLPACIGD